MPDPAQSLLLEYLHPQKDFRILALEGGSGWLAAEVARLVPDGEILTLDRDIRSVTAAQTVLASIPNAATALDVLPATSGWDRVLLTIPKGRRYARTLLLAAWRALKPDGQLLLAGPSKGGAKAVIQDAARIFGNASVLGYRRHQRVAVCTRGHTLPDPLPPEFQQPGIAPGTRHFVTIERSHGDLKLETHPGIFSWEALDEGTALLLDHLEFDSGAHVWDVGCGYGVLGLSAALAGAAHVTMSDVNLLATRYTQTNAAKNGLTHKVTVFPADALSPSHPQPPYNLIISNPAFHQGRDVDKSMADRLINQAPGFLAPGGRLLLVANRFLNYHKFMHDHFERVSRIAETPKFHLIQAYNT